MRSRNRTCNYLFNIVYFLSVVSSPELLHLRARCKRPNQLLPIYNIVACMTLCVYVFLAIHTHAALKYQIRRVATHLLKYGIFRICDTHLCILYSRNGSVSCLSVRKMVPYRSDIRFVTYLWI